MLDVVFATRNRAAALPPVLDALAAVEAPPGGWQLLVVDNGSTDATPQLLRRYADRLPLRALHEPRAGKNRALNRALPFLRGQLAIFTDDDVLPEPDWLRRWHEAGVAQPQASMFGGTVALHWPTPPPAWLDARTLPFSVLYAENLRPSGPCGPHEIFGPNMALRPQIFASGLRFAEGVGPDASNPRYAMGSETELLRRLGAAGHRGWFAADAVLSHIVRPEQMTEAWVLARAFRYGRGAGRAHAALEGWRLAWRRALCTAAGQLLPPGQLRLRSRWRGSELAGIAAALREEHLDARGRLACT